MRRLRAREIIAASLAVVGGTAAAAPQSTQAQPPATTTATASNRAEYAEAFKDLYEHPGWRYACLQLKGINWRAVGNDLLPKAAGAQTEQEFGLLCTQLVGVLAVSMCNPQRCIF